MCGRGDEKNIFFSLHNSTRASYKEKNCPVFVPFERLELCKILAISPLWTFSGDGRIPPLRLKFFIFLAVNYLKFYKNRFIRKPCPVCVPAQGVGKVFATNYLAPFWTELLLQIF